VKHITILLVTLFCISKSNAQLSISINAPKSLFDTSITAITISDVQLLLKKSCNCEVSVNNQNALIQISLPEVSKEKASTATAFSTAANFPYKHFPNHDFEWKQERSDQQYILILNATSWQGVSFGLYALLQEKLGFKFYHPRETIVPVLNQWPLNSDFVWQGKPIFDKKGFHLHTQHPLELTEQLHDGTIPHALDDIKEYINWLTRNGQNYFEFCLLESIDRKVWINHAKDITDYVHQRGLFAAVDLSLHMIQQKTFQLYKSPAAKKKQIEKNLAWLNQANWDFMNMEFSTAEFIGGNKSKKEKLRQFIIKWLKENSNTKLMGRQHVVRHEKEISSGKQSFLPDSAALALDKERGVLSHTVMFYDMTEAHAPVYENENQQHMFQFLLREHQKRETWYYPESAYWITFDVSVPMLLLPYLKARLADIDTCAAYNIPGHITFSSGWEWGYWLIDWSIARWSWQHTENGLPKNRTPTMYANELLLPEQHEMLNRQLQLQQNYLKDSALMQWMTAMTVTDELGIKALANEYHPRPKTSYKYIRNKATQAELDVIKSRYLSKLDSFGKKSIAVLFSTNNINPDDAMRNAIQKELIDGIAITALRALHRAATLRYLISYREAKLQHKKFEGDSLLEKARLAREMAQSIVSNREKFYRYPVDLIARKRWDHTAYHFGYLYPVSNLHFWNREEQQAIRNKYKYSFMNIWSVARIIGLIK
jgi:hypothetical protein